MHPQQYYRDEQQQTGAEYNRPGPEGVHPGLLDATNRNPVKAPERGAYRDGNAGQQVTANRVRHKLLVLSRQYITYIRERLHIGIIQIEPERLILGRQFDYAYFSNRVYIYPLAVDTDGEHYAVFVTGLIPLVAIATCRKFLG
jgi:hypothetical protein